MAGEGGARLTLDPPSHPGGDESKHFVTEQALRAAGIYPSEETNSRTMRYKDSPAGAVLDTGSGRVEIQFSTYGGFPDSYGDIIDPGAFNKAIQAAQSNPRQMPYLIYSHDWNSLPLGKVSHLYDTPSGPVADCQFDLGDEYASRVYGKIRKGLIREASFGFEVEQEQRGADGANHLKSIYPLFEVSPVLVGANRNTSISARGFGRRDAALREAFTELVVARLSR
jgi:HK97 family phage prohead protease